MAMTIAIGFVVSVGFAWFRYYRLRHSFEDVMLAFLGAMAVIVLFAVIGDIIGQASNQR